MKKSLVLLFTSILILTLACNDEQPTKVETVSYDKYNIQNDSDWVELTDFDTVKTCFALGVFEGGLLLRDMDTIEALISQSKAFLKNNGFENKSYDSAVNACKILEFDFVKKDIIVYFKEFGGSTKGSRKFYINEKQKTYLYLFNLQKTKDSTDYLVRKYFFDELSIPKLSKGYNLVFDSIITYFD